MVEFGLLGVVLRLGPALPWSPATAIFFPVPLYGLAFTGLLWQFLAS